MSRNVRVRGMATHPAWWNIRYGELSCAEALGRRKNIVKREEAQNHPRERAQAHVFAEGSRLLAIHCFFPQAHGGRE